MTKQPSFMEKLTEEEITRRVFLDCLAAWTSRDLEGALGFMSDDVVHILNVDGMLVPCAASVEGKPALRKKLQLLFDTFTFDALVNDGLRVERCTVTAHFKFIYTHTASGERLIGCYRFITQQRDGLIFRMEEYHDAAYIEAFFRLVSMVS